MELLEVQNLRVSFRQKKQLIQAVRGVSFSIRGERESVGIVGESGSGKSVSGLAIMRLIEEPPGRVSAERLMLSGVDLLAQRDRQMQSLRGREISMVFQEPMSSLDPVFTIGQQLVETIVLHQRATRKQAKEIAAELLRKVEIPEPKHALESYPHELSGGMRQRAMIAIALSCHPRILIADEPTTALDVTVQAQVLQLIKDLQGELGMALILITHDLGVIADTTDRIVVMYGGRVLETGSAIDIFESAAQPYTQALLKSIPRAAGGRREPLYAIEGAAPNPMNPPGGCPFHPRCPVRMDVCSERFPDGSRLSDGHEAWCWRLR